MISHLLGIELLNHVSIIWFIINLIFRKGIVNLETW